MSARSARARHWHGLLRNGTGPHQLAARTPGDARIRGDTAWMAPNASPHRTGTRIDCSLCGIAVGAGVSVGISPAISRACVCWRADPLVDHLPDLLVQLVLLPDA